MNTIEPIPWRGFRAIDKLIAFLLPLPAIAVLILPFLDQIFLRRLARQPGMMPIVNWLINGRGSWILGGALLLLAFAYLLWMRHRLVSNKRLWYGTGCPACGERELVRVSRQFSDRFYGLLAVPAYRYACRNCTWRGLRIARREHSRQTELDLEAALLRFDPDALPSEAIDGETPRQQARRRGGSMFRDAGDVPRADSPPAPPATDGGEAAPAPDDDEAEPPVDLEWLWEPEESDRV